MSIFDKRIYSDFLSVDFRSRGAISFLSNEKTICIYNTLLEAKMKLRVAENTLSEAERTKKIVVKSSEIVGYMLGVSAKIVENCRFIQDYASQDIKNQVMSGTLSISQAALQTREYRAYQKRKAGKARGRPRTTPGAPLLTIFEDAWTDVFKDVPKGEFTPATITYIKANCRKLMNKLSESMSREGWIGKPEAEDIKRMLDGKQQAL